MEKRYVAEVDFYIYAKDDNEAKRKLTEVVNEMNQVIVECSSPSVLKFVEQPTGTLLTREIKFDKL